VSRVGGKAQLPAYRTLTGELRLSYSQFQELEAFARFGTRLDEETRHTLRHGQRVREVLKQEQYAPMPVDEQVAVLVATTEGLLDDLPLDQVEAAEARVRTAVREQQPGLCDKIRDGEPLSDDDLQAVRDTARDALEPITDRADADA